MLQSGARNLQRSSGGFMSSAKDAPLTMARRAVCSYKFRQPKLGVGTTTDARLSMSRSSTQQKQRREERRISKKDSDVWDPSPSIKVSRILMQNAGAGGKLGCLLNVIHQQIRLQRGLWSSQVQFLTKDGYMPLRLIRARRLKSLLALACHLDEKDRNCRQLLPNRSDSKSPTEDTLQLQQELQQMSLAE